MENLENIQNSNNPLLISTTGADPMLSAALSNDCPLSPLNGLIDNNSRNSTNGSISNHHQTHTLKSFQFYDADDDNFYRKEPNKHNEYFYDRCTSQMIMPCSFQMQSVLPSISAVTHSKLLKESNTACNISLSDDNLSPIELINKSHQKQLFHSPNHLNNSSLCDRFTFSSEYGNNNNSHNHDDNNHNTHHFSPTSSSIYTFDSLQQSAHHHHVQNNGNRNNGANGNSNNSCFNFDDDLLVLSGSLNNNNNLNDESNNLLAYKLHNFNNSYNNNNIYDNSITSSEAPLSATTTESTSCSSSIDFKSNSLCLNENKCFQFFNSEDNSIQDSSDNDDNKNEKINNCNELNKKKTNNNDNDNEKNYIQSYNTQQQLKKNFKFIKQNLPINNMQKVSIKYEYDRASISNDNTFNNYNLSNGDTKQLILNKSNEYIQPNVRIHVTNINNNSILPKETFFEVIFFN